MKTNLLLSFLEVPSAFNKTTKHFLVLLALFFAFGYSAKAQNNFTIPDANFAAWLNANIPNAMSGVNLMDTTHVAVTTKSLIDLVGLNIANLSGIQYFTSLTNLQVYNNPLTSLPALPSSLIHLFCASNQLTSLPALPSSLTSLECSNNQLTSLPALPSSLVQLTCGNNQLTSLPALPSLLTNLSCDNNQLTSLPALPISLYYLNCITNQLTSLPALPSSLAYLICSDNNIVCFPKFHDTLSLTITPNPFTCLPNYIFTMDADLLAYPLCVNGDTANNNSGCPSAEGIVGYTYKDNNSNCIKDVGELSIDHIQLKLYDNSNNLLSQVYSLANGIYNFSATAGTYTVTIDTTGMPFTVQCAYPGVDSTVTLTNGNPLATDVNFAITCKPGFDVGVQSVFSNGWVFPGQPHSLSIVAGDLSQWYNFNCATGVSGQVQITITGPVSYTGTAAGALTPTITGNVFTYTIADFGTINNSDAFGLLFTTDTSAQAGDQICVNVIVTPTNGDNNITNNTYQFCYQVINSYDPNMKEVYPVNVLPNYQDWFTYTIHFQNTGTAPAFNIRLLDTLSNHLDMETFQVINYSHYNLVSLQNKVLTFRFPNIMLPDSTSNLAGSKGFVQYRIKPKANLPLGTQIKNTAHIYFDFNTPIVTNTTQNEFTATASISEFAKSNAEVSVYPNPFNANAIFVIKSEKTNETYSFEMFDVLGKTVKSVHGITTKQFQISRDNIEAGIYFYKIYSAERIIGNGKVVIK